MTKKKNTPVLRAQGEDPTPATITKSYAVRDKWLDKAKDNLVEFKSVDGEISDLKVNGEPAGGGGGGDFTFSLATLTLDLSGAAGVSTAVIVRFDELGTADGWISADGSVALNTIYPNTLNILVPTNGTGVVTLNNFDDITMKLTCTGDVTTDGYGGIYVRGNGTAALGLK